MKAQFLQIVDDLWAWAGKHAAILCLCALVVGVVLVFR